ncbi:MAG: ABC transporter ATP-binding protein [Acidobacteriota bacterium]|nr:ABC transporter ATP-binding protein [Acidobacteriota bacterium]
MNSPVVLDVRDLSVEYRAGEQTIPAVNSVDLVLHRGEVLGLAGESGSGKSTLAYAMTRLLRPPGVITAGDVWFRDARGAAAPLAVLDAGPAELRRVRWAEIAIVFQSALHALNPVLTVESQLGDVLKAHRGLARAARRERCAELLGLVGISADRLRSYPHELSGGMRQRVMIAMALALEPQVVIMDEPTTALDAVTQREILAEVLSLRERLGFSVVFITHDLSLLIEIADSIAVMYAGRLVEQGPAQDLFRDPRHPYTKGLVDSFPPLHGIRGRLEGIPGSPPDLRDPPPGCPFHPRCSRAEERCRRELPLLEPLPVRPSARAVRLAACWNQLEPSVESPEVAS